jgi:hypothetical protein
LARGRLRGGGHGPWPRHRPRCPRRGHRQGPDRGARNASKVGRAAKAIASAAELGSDINKAAGAATTTAKASDDVVGALDDVAAGALCILCFGEGTPVETAEGPKPIESLQVGDQVLAQDPETGALAYQPVTHVYERPDRPVLELSLLDGAEEETLVVTPEHPFWVKNRGWTPAGELRDGMLVPSASGGWLQVGAGSWLQERRTVFNIEVGDFHTYFAGQSAAWVHKRLKTHERTGRLTPGTETRTTVDGGKTAREIAEHKRIQQHTGGGPARRSDAVSNKVDPIGPKRQHLLDDD